jgi:hypothetical protein
MKPTMLSIGAMLPSLCLGHLDKYSDGMIRFGHLVGVHDDTIPEQNFRNM